jgi:hypothetical protein
VYSFLRHSFDDLTTQYGGVVGTAFRGFPSYPQRYSEALNPQPEPPRDVTCRVEPLRLPRATTRFTEDDLVMREFLRDTSRRVIRKGASVAA